MVLLIQNGRCYKAEICSILFPLRCAIAWYYFLHVLLSMNLIKMPYYSPGFSAKKLRKRFRQSMIPSERESQEKQNGGSFSFVAPSSEEL